MDPIQNKVIGLLQEIHNICERLNIYYVLGGVTAEEAQVFNTLTPGRYTAEVYMTLKDFVIFRDYVEGSPESGRIIEGMNNNIRFPGFFFRYTDTNTTYYDYNFGNTYIHNGIHVKITVLRKYYSPGKAKRLVNAERSFSFNSYKYKRKLSAKSLFLKWWMGLRLAFGRKRIALGLYGKFMEYYTENRDFVINYGIFNKNKTKLVKYPSYLITGRKKAMLCNGSFYVPGDIEVHTKIALGRQPLLAPPGKINNTSVVVSDIIPYASYMGSMKDRQKTARHRQQLWITDQLHGGVTYFIRKDWKIMQCVNARLDLMKQYMPLKNQICGMYSRGDFEGLTDILEDYDEQVRFHLGKTGMTIYFDKDIFDIYLMWVTRKYGAKTAGKISKSVPGEWLKNR
ncbi:MAG: hypothetical protein ACI4EN_03145 [Butyrivibrio sp.]